MFAHAKLCKKFKDEEDGSMILFGLYIFSALLLLAGVALSVIAHEETRIRLQSVIDTSVLAAADLNQQLDPESVVVDYFDKTGLSENLKRVKVTESLNSREVLAEAEMTVNTLLLGAIGYTEWTVNTLGAAREDISNIEVSLVLDASGSMDSYGRMDALKSAAKDFVDDVLLVDSGTSQEGEVSISIIPYSTQVSMPQVVLDQMNLEHRHDYSGCVDFEVSDFTTTALPSASRAQTAHFDPSSTGTTPYRWVCSPESEMVATLFSQDPTELKNAIDAMEPYEWTSIDLGVKWGAAMLDPSAQGVVDALADADMVDEVFRGRPYEHTQPNKMKVLVVMTDGANTYQYKLDDDVASGNSDIWEYNGKYSVWVPGGDQSASIMLDGISNVQQTRRGGGSSSCNGRSGWNCGGNSGGDDDDDDDGVEQGGDEDPGDEEEVIVDDEGNVYENFFIVDSREWELLPEGGLWADRQDWQEIWANFTLYKHAYDFRYRQNYKSSVYNEWRSGIYETIDQEEKDARMSDICTAAKNAGIIVFTIGFEIDPTNAAKMQACASSSNHYFDVDNNTIDLAFAAIANSINQLRLVQ